MSVVFKLADHPRRKELTAKLQKLKDDCAGLKPEELMQLSSLRPEEVRQMCAGLSRAEVRQKEVDIETNIISAAMDRLADYASKSQMVDVVEGLLERKAGGVK
jgi:hypothetical protein